MVIFGLIMLVLMAFALQHVVNWLFREAAKHDNSIAILGAFTFLISCALIYTALNYVHNNPQEFIIK